MKYIRVFLLLFLSFSGVARAADIAPKEYQRVTNQLSQAVQLFRNLAKIKSSFDEKLPRRDPLKALVDGQGKFVGAAGLYDGPQLEGIVHSDGFIRALIDNQFYAVGDTLGPYRIQEIRDDGVQLEEKNSTLFVPLYPNSQERNGVS